MVHRSRSRRTIKEEFNESVTQESNRMLYIIYL
jgi:hypothetical protein